MNKFQELFESAGEDLLGYTQLLGSLFLKSMISFKLLLVCIEDLISPILTCMSEANLLRVEGVILIFKVGGPRIFVQRHAKHIETVVEKLQQAQSLVPPRLKLLLMNVFDMHLSPTHKLLQFIND